MSTVKGILKILVVLPLSFSYLVMDAQDIHFSQFNFSPLNQNPGNTNLFDGDYRFVFNYKNQWPTVPVRYNTVSFSGEMNFITLKNNDRIGGGALFYYDQEGDSRFTSLNADLSLSYIKALGKKSQHYISYAIMVGVVNRSIDYSQLNFDNQWNGEVFNPNIPINESFERTNFAVFDMGTGLAYRYEKTERTNFLIGFGVMHLTQPHQSFFNDNAILLSRRYTANTRIQIQVSKAIDIVPEMMFQRQQTTQEFDLGGYINYHLLGNTEHDIALNLGAYGRITDAGWLMAGVDYDGLQFNFSYDINFSQLTAASRYNGGVELSAIYILAKVKKISKPGVVCPAFL